MRQECQVQWSCSFTRASMLKGTLIRSPNRGVHNNTRRKQPQYLQRLKAEGFDRYCLFRFSCPRSPNPSPFICPGSTRISHVHQFLLQVFVFSESCCVFSAPLCRPTLFADEIETKIVCRVKALLLHHGSLDRRLAATSAHYLLPPSSLLAGAPRETRQQVQYMYRKVPRWLDAGPSFDLHFFSNGIK